MTHPAHRLQNCLQNRPIRRAASSRALPIVVAITVFLVACAAIVPAARAQDAAAPGQPVTEAEAMAAQDKFQKASLNADATALQSLMADDAIFIHGSAAAQTKAEYIASIAGGQLKLTAYDLKDHKVLIFPGGAIVSGLTDVGLAPPSGAVNGAVPRMLHMRVSTVWVRNANGSLQLVLNQGTPLQGGASFRRVGSNPTNPGAALGDSR